MDKSSKPSQSFVEFAHETDDQIPKPDNVREKGFTGAVHLLDGEVTYLIPSPSADPRDPLNLPKWRKWLLTFVVGIFSSVGLCFVGGLGGLLTFYIPKYTALGYGYNDITHLMTYPTLFMGLGNFIGMPLALALGRRPVFLGATALIVAMCILCATAKSYEMHLGSRMALGLAAGQSEALAPLIVEEAHFLHERATCLMLYTAVQIVLTAVLTLSTSYIGASIGSNGWYFLGAGLAGFVLVVSLLAVPETKYPRPLMAYRGNTFARVDTRGGLNAAASDGLGGYDALERFTTTQPREMDLARYSPRTIASDLRLFVFKPNWMESWRCITTMCQVLLFPNIFWAFFLNGITLGINIAMNTTYGTILSAPPYGWKDSIISLAQTGQIVVAVVALPLLGIGSDRIVKYFARRHGGVHQPEYRLIPLAIPTLFGVLSALVYGEAAQHPQHFHWIAIVFAISANYFAFIGANQACIVYALDAYPTRSGSVLVIICALRGIMSFGTSYAISPFINRVGYDGVFGFYAGLSGLVGLLGIVVFYTGRRIREWTSKYLKEE